MGTSLSPEPPSPQPPSQHAGLPTGCLSHEKNTPSCGEQLSGLQSGVPGKLAVASVSSLRGTLEKPRYPSPKPLSLGTLAFTW